LQTVIGTNRIVLQVASVVISFPFVVVRRVPLWFVVVLFLLFAIVFRLFPHTEYTSVYPYHQVKFCLISRFWEKNFPAPQTTADDRDDRDWPATTAIGCQRTPVFDLQTPVLVRLRQDRRQAAQDAAYGVSDFPPAIPSDCT